MGTENHPIWSLYDLLRTARLNVKYYSARLHKTELKVFWMDLVLLITVPSSSVAGLWFWEHPIGKIAWQYLGGGAAFIAVLKPLLGLTKRIKAYEELKAGYRGLEHDLLEIKELVVQKRKYDRQLQDEFRKALKREGVLVSKEPDSKEDKKLKKECVSEVMRELPVESFYVPEEV